MEELAYCDMESAPLFDCLMKEIEWSIGKPVPSGHIKDIIDIFESRIMLDSGIEYIVEKISKLGVELKEAILKYELFKTIVKV